MKHKPTARWQLFLWSLGVLVLTLACAAVGLDTGTVTNTPSSEEVAFQLENDMLQVQAQNGDWMPVAGSSTFDLTAELEGLDPWSAAGITFETDESTHIEDGLQVGELVRVQGLILKDGTWLANSIARAEEQIDPVIILIGRVNSIDPWVVKGIELNVTEETVIQGTILPGTIVKVEILLAPDDTWEVLSIIPLGELDENDACVTVVAEIASVEGNEIRLSGWPIVIPLDENIKIETQAGDEGTLHPNQTVLLVMCPSEDGQVVIVKVIIPDADEDEVQGEGNEKVLICHKPDKNGGHTLSIASPAVPAHLAHGDTLGPCP